MKKLFSIIMCVLMVMCFMPTMAFAGSVDISTTTETSCSHEAAIGNVHYDTLADAVTASQSGDTIKLLKSVETSTMISVAAGKTLTINTNGFTITNSSSQYAINNSGTLTINGGGAITRNNATYSAIRTIGTLTLENITITIEPSESLIAVKVDEDGVGTKGTLIVNNGTVINATDGQAIQAWGDVTINGGTINGRVTAWSVKDWNPGKITVAGGTINGNLEAYQRYYVKNNVGSYPTASASISVTNGKINGELVKRYVEVSGRNTVDKEKSGFSVDSKIEVSGGTFSSNPTAYVANNYAAVGNTDGTWEVKSTTSTEAGTSITVTTDESNNKTVVETKTEGSTTTTKTSVTNNDGSTSTTVKTTGTPDSTGATTSTETKLEVKTVEGTTVETKTEATTVKTTTNVETTEKTITTTTGSGDPVVTTEKVVKDPANNTEVDTKVTGTKAETTANVSTPTSNKETITVDATAATVTTESVTDVKVTLPKETVTVLKNAATATDESQKIETVELKTDVAILEIDNKALKTLTEDAGENALVLTVAKTDSTVTPPSSTTEQTTTVTATYELTAKVGTQDAFTSNNSATNGNITINVNYAPKDSSKAIKVYYVNGNTKTDMGATYYNNKLTWKTNHFSTFQVEETEAVKYGGSSSSKTSKVDKTEDTTKDTGDTSGSSTVEEKDTKAEVTKLVNALSFKARSSKTKKGSIKVNLTVSNEDIKEITDLGYTVKYKFYRSTKKSSAYTATLEKDAKTYVNTTGVSGTRYYYKARVMVYDSEGTLVAKTALKQCKYASRIK